MDLDLLKQTAQAMVASGKGILAIDESHGTCKKRFDALGVECNEETRRAYRGLLVTAPVGDSVSGMILFDETIRQKTDDGRPFPKVLSDAGILPGIKVDTGAKELALHEGEKVTEGLDGLRDRLAEYAELGAKFAKWRAVITIKGDEMPSSACIHANAHALARYAALCQEAGLVPIVEPEILIDGDHTQERCYEVSARTWQKLFKEMKDQDVVLEGVILKTSMVLSGKDAADRADHQQVAEQTVKCLKENVPAELAGVVFLSGGQTDEDSTIHLNLINKLEEEKPWPLTFSYGRSIQRPALDSWAKNPDDIEGAQKKLAHRAKMNGLAAKGEWTEDAEAEL